MNRGQTVTKVLIGISSFAFMFLVSWNGWLSLTVISHGEALAHISEWQISADKRFDKFDHLLEEMNKKIDLISPRLGVNPQVIYLATSSSGIISAINEPTI